MVTECPPLSAIVLAGGRATRLGGTDKGLVLLAGKPLIAHVLERLRPQVDDIVINANRNAAIYAALGAMVVADAEATFTGPLAGIAAALPRCRHEWVLVVACDCPLLPANLAALLQAGLQQGISVAVAHDGQHVQPLFLLLHRSLVASVQDALARGDYKVENWIRRQAFAEVRFPDAAVFSNINTEAERLALQAMLTSPPPPLRP